MLSRPINGKCCNPPNTFNPIDNGLRQFCNNSLIVLNTLIRNEKYLIHQDIKKIKEFVYIYEEDAN